MEDKSKLLVALRDSVANRIQSLFASVAQSDKPRLRLSALGLCPRATVLSVRTGITADLTEAAGILAAGHLFENFIAEAFEGEEIYPQFEVELAGVKGHIDFYFPQRKFLIECKTIAAARCSPEFLPTSFVFLSNPPRKCCEKQVLADVKQRQYRSPDLCGQPLPLIPSHPLL